MPERRYENQHDIYMHTHESPSFYCVPFFGASAWPPSRKEKFPVQDLYEREREKRKLGQEQMQRGPAEKKGWGLLEVLAIGLVNAYWKWACREK